MNDAEQPYPTESTHAMTPAKIATVAAAIAETRGKRAYVANLIDDRQRAHAAIEADIAAAQSDLDALVPEQETLLAREAVGDNVFDGLAALRLAVSAAMKRVAMARKREVDARELSMAEKGLQHRIDDIDARLYAENCRPGSTTSRRSRPTRCPRTPPPPPVWPISSLASWQSVKHSLPSRTKTPASWHQNQCASVCPVSFGQPTHLMTAGAFPKLKAAAADRVRKELAEAGAV